jgi:predicted acetyltransferase
MPIDVRTIKAGELPDWLGCMGVAFFHEMASGYAEYFLPEVDLGRTWAGFDGKQVVATLRSFETSFTVPGPGQVSAAALTNVTVATTHRRSGQLTKMITADLAGAAERGEAIGILIASEYPIYGRFGYGPGIEAARYTVDTLNTHFLQPGIGTVERVDLATLRREAPPLYDRVRLAQPGAITRSDRWWDRVLQQVPTPGAEPYKGYSALYRSPDGEPQGYVRYQGKQDWDDMRPKGVLTINELVATSPGAYQRLWQYCFDVDLMTTIEAGDRSVVEPLAYLVTDARAVRQSLRYDFVWIRVLDVCAALSGRRYPVEDHLVIEVVDPLGHASGCYALDGGPDGAKCSRSDEAADLTMPVDAMGTIYVGGVSPYALALAGRVDEHRDGALAKAALMFSSYRHPWCSTRF